MGKLPYVFAVGIHRVDIQIAVTHGCEDDFLAIFGYRRLGVIARRRGQLLQIRPVGVCRENVVAGVYRPYVSLGKIWPWWTCRVRKVRGRVQNLPSVRIEEAARRPTLASGHHTHLGTVDVHGKDLVALHIAMRGLKDNLFSVGRKIRFGILSTES